MKNLIPLPLLLVAGVAAAQPNVIDLAPITVTASPEVDTTSQYLRPVTVVTRQDIERQQPSSTMEVLRLLPGIAVKRTGGRAGQTSVLMRGTAANHVLVLVNGVPANSVTTGSFDWRSITPEQIQRIEIDRGSSTTRFGAGAIGGVVRIYTRDPIGWHMQVEGGSHETLGGSIGYGGQLGTLNYAFNYSTESSDGINATQPGSPYYEADRDGYDSQSFSLNTNYRFNDDVQLGLNLWHSRNDLDYDDGPKAPNARWENENTVVSLDFAQSLTENWHHDLQVGYSDESAVAHAAWPADISADRFNINWQHKLQISSTQQLSGGVSWQRTEADVMNGYKQTTDNRAIFAGWRGQFNAHTLDLGLRYDDYEQFGSETTGSIAWAYVVNPEWEVNASYATAFNAPAFNLLYFPPVNNPNLRPEKASNIEAGMRWRPNANSHVQLQLFHTEIEDMIVSNSNTGWVPFNVNKAEIDGLELTYTGQSELWHWQTSLTLLDAQDGHGDDLYYRPEEKLTLLLGRKIGAGQVQASVILVSERPVQDGTLAGYSLLNLSASYPIGEGVTLFGRIDNVTDKYYTLSEGYNTPGRQFLVGLRYAP